MIKIMFATVAGILTGSGIAIGSNDLLIIGAVYLVGFTILDRLDNLVLVEARNNEPTN